MWKAKPKAGQVCKGCPNFPVALLSVAIQHHPTSASLQVCVSPTSAAPAMTWGLLAGRRHPARMGGCIHVGPLRVGQAVFSFLLTLHTTAGWWGRKDNILTPVLLADPSVPTSKTCEWQFPSPKGTAAPRQGISCIYPRHLKAIFFSPQPECWLLSFNRPWNCFP